MARQRKRTSLDREGALAPFLETLDLKILSALRENGRLTMNDMSEKVALSPSACWTRVKRLEETGIISGYIALLSRSALGLSNTVFVEITLRKHDEQTLRGFGDAVALMPEVVEAHLVTGDYDYLLKIAVSDTAHYERFLRERLYRVDGIQHSRSTFALRSLKEDPSVDPAMLSSC